MDTNEDTRKTIDQNYAERSYLACMQMSSPGHQSLSRFSGGEDKDVWTKAKITLKLKFTQVQLPLPGHMVKKHSQKNLARFNSWF